jgi:two-component system chemotaxis response regulator CheB
MKGSSSGSQEDVFMIRVLVVDDSAVVRKILTDELSKHRDIEVVGSAVDPYVAREKIASLRPDVITLDIEMPKMDGLTFLSKLMKHFPLPVVVISSRTRENSDTALRALALGAVEIIPKPSSQYSVPTDIARLARAIRAAAAANISKRPLVDESPHDQPAATSALLQTTHKVLAIGASTGGTQAIESVLRNLPAAIPGTVIVQHMPEFFTAPFAARLNQVCPMEVREAKDGDYVAPGIALVAPGNKHLVLQQSGAKYMARIKDGPPVHHQRPAVDVLFMSVAKSAGANAVGVILTGMGADGAMGLLAMRESGACTLAQDEKSCIVFGMPKEAIKLDAAQKVVPLSLMPQAILSSLASTEK